MLAVTVPIDEIAQEPLPGDLQEESRPVTTTMIKDESADGGAVHFSFASV